nr:putative ribonuclease H-like domain-containing protein [Tanacetum cinerariifolium]
MENLSHYGSNDVAEVDDCQHSKESLCQQDVRNKMLQGIPTVCYDDPTANTLCHYWSSNGLQLKKVDMSCVHALNEPHLHEIHVVLKLFTLAPEVYVLKVPATKEVDDCQHSKESLCQQDVRNKMLQGIPTVCYDDPTANTLCHFIEFGDSYKAPPEETGKGPASESSAKKKGMTVVITTEDMQKRRNDVKARTTLLLALPDEHQLRLSKYETANELWEAILKTFGGNEATKKSKKNQLKMQYGNFKAKGSKTLEQTFNILQAIMSHLEFMDEENHALVADDEVPIEFALMAKSGSSSNNEGNLQNNIDDKGYWNSGCSRHMTGNISYLSEYEPYDGGYVLFGHEGGKITENLKDLKVKIIRCDNGGEFKNQEMNELCTKKGIRREFNNARTPQQNGVAERRNRTLIEVARTMLADAKLPVTFWAEAVNSACYV